MSNPPNQLLARMVTIMPRLARLAADLAGLLFLLYFIGRLEPNAVCIPPPTVDKEDLRI